MGWRRPGAGPLSEPMAVSLLTHICVTRPQWVNIMSVIFKLISKILILWISSEIAHMLMPGDITADFIQIWFGWWQGAIMSAQVEWWLKQRHGWRIKHQWAGSVSGRVSHDEYQVVGSTSIPARLDTLVYWEPFSWLARVGTIRNTVIRLGWSSIGLAVPIQHAAGVGLTGRPTFIRGRCNKHYSYRTITHTFHRLVSIVYSNVCSGADQRNHQSSTSLAFLSSR